MDLKSLKVTTPSDREVKFERTFDAPRALVWDAMTRPELLKRWLFGPPGWEMTVCEGDARVGATFRWAWRGPAGEELAMSGAYREVAVPERMVRTERFEMSCVPQSGEQLCTMTLVEEKRRTRMTIVVVYPSKEARDGALASGMEHGMEAGYARLDGMLTATSGGASASAKS